MKKISKTSKRLTKKAAALRVLILALAISLPELVSALPETAQPHMKRGYLDSQYGQIHFREAKPEKADITEPPLLLFHQSPLSGRMFDQFMPYLAKNRIVIALDTPGYGESDRPKKRPTAVEYSDAMIEAILAGYGSHDKKIDILGYHTGANLAAIAASRHPEYVRRLVLISVAHFGEEKRQEILASFSEELSFSQNGSHLPPLWKGTQSVKPEGQSVQDVARIVAEKQRAGAYKDWAYISIFEQDLKPFLKEVQQPTFILIPYDGLQKETLSAASLIRHSQMTEYPEQGYGLFDAAPEQLATPIHNFLTRKQN